MSKNIGRGAKPYHCPFCRKKVGYLDKIGRVTVTDLDHFGVCPKAKWLKV